MLTSKVDLVKLTGTQLELPETLETVQPAVAPSFEHTCLSVEHYTPSFIVEAAREVLGVIDLDPASNMIANRTVNASFYYDQGSNGLEASWNQPLARPSSIFLNPPTPSKLWWIKLLEEVALGHVSHAIFVGFSVQLVQTSQLNTDASILDYPCCFPQRRVAYLDPTGKAQKSPPGASVIVYVPGTVDRSYEFGDVFCNLGAVTIPWLGEI